MTPRPALPIAVAMLLAANVPPSGQLDGQWTIAEQPSVVIGAVTGDPNDGLVQQSVSILRCP